MKISVNKISLSYGKISHEEYQSIIGFANRERASYKNNMFSKKQLRTRALEILNSIERCKSVNVRNDSNGAYRKNINISNNTEKQIFINNFLFPTENFINALEKSNIDYITITRIINGILDKKKEAKISGNYELEIPDSIDMESIALYFNYNNMEALINKMIEIYFLEKDLLLKNNKVKAKRG